MLFWVSGVCWASLYPWIRLGGWSVFCLLGLGLVGGIGFVSGVVLEHWVGCRAAGV